MRAGRLLLIGLALGAAAAALWAWRRAERAPSRPRAWNGPDRRREAAPAPNGRMDVDALADESSRESFPASDAPAYMVSLRPGAPARPLS